MPLSNSLLKEITRVANQYGIPANVYIGLIRQESSFNQHARSPVGAIGYAQLMPGTARGLGVNPNNPHQNLIGGAKYLRQQLDKFGDIRKALAAYNAGPGAVSKYGGIPPYAETQNYVKQVMKYAGIYSGAGGSGASAASVETVPPQISYASPELARSPTLPTLARTPIRGVMGTSVRSPTLRVTPLSILNPSVSGGSFGMDQTGQPASIGYPLGKTGKIIGTPNSGTHNLGNWQSDNAVDIAVPKGTPVYAVSDGVIGSRIGSLGKGGRFAGLRVNLIGKGNAYYYAHLSKLAVHAGQHVRRGQLLGYSGVANGVAHLHFGVENGNPESLLG